MEQTEPQHRGALRSRRVTIAIVLLLGLTTAAASAAWITTRRTEDRPVQVLRLHPNQRPYAVSANSTWLPDGALVIGVNAAGRYRAYAIGSFSMIGEHVVNDLLSGVPITVAYCNRNDCTRVYTDPNGDRPLTVAVGGWVGEPGSGPDGVMLLRIDSNFYFQDTGEVLEGWGRFPYPETTFERTTWGAWRQAHPDTDVVAGVIRPQEQ